SSFMERSNVDLNVPAIFIRTATDRNRSAASCSRGMDLRSSSWDKDKQHRVGASIPARLRLRKALRRRRFDRHLAIATRSLLATTAQRRDPEDFAQGAQGRAGCLHPWKSRRIREHVCGRLREYLD